MHEDILKKAFLPLSLSPESNSYFFDSWEEVSFKKGDYITESGATEKYFYVVIEGVQAIYILSREGEKKVIGFSYDGSFSGVYDSFLKLRPSHYFLEALTASKMIRIKKEHYDHFFQLYPAFNEWGRIIHQELLIGRVQREVELITMSARERFDNFMARCPEELTQVPQKYIASYLNMTPETFSRLRAAIS